MIHDKNTTFADKILYARKLSNNFFVNLLLTIFNNISSNFLFIHIVIIKMQCNFKSFL